MIALTPAPDDPLDGISEVAFRLGNLAELLSGLVNLDVDQRLREAALLVAADSATDTYRQLAVLVENMHDDDPTPEVL